MAKTPEKPGGSFSAVAAALIGVAALLAYGASLLNDYAWDDGSVVKENRTIRDWRGLVQPFKLFSDDYVHLFHEASYRPVVTLSYFIDGLVWHAHPVGGHLFNVLLHVLVALLVYVLALRFVRPPWVAALAGVLFAAHPVLSEVVVQVCFREDLLCAAFALGAALCFLKDEAGKGSLVGALLLGLALLSKEMALAVPLVLIAYEAAMRPKERRHWWRRSMTRLTPYLVVWGLFIALTVAGRWVTVLPHAPDAYLEHRFDMVWMGYGTSPKAVEAKQQELGPVLFFLSTSSAKLALMPRIFTHHLWKIAVPAWLNNEYGWPLERLSGAWPWLAGVAGASAYLVVTLLLWRRSRLAGFGLLAFALLLLPVWGLAQLSYVIADRFVYLPMTVLAILMAAGLAHGIERPFARRSAAWSAALALLLLCFILLAVGRCADWRSDFALWKRTVTLNPKSAKAWVNLGRRYEEMKPSRRELAARLYARAIQLDPNLPPAYVALSSHFMQKGDYRHAIEVLRECNDRGIFSTLARYNLAGCYLQLGDYRSALEHYNAIQRPDSNVYRMRGVAYYRLGLYAEAQGSLLKAIQEKPDFTEAMFDLALVLSARKDLPGAMAVLARVEAIEPGNCNISGARGTILSDAGRYAEAEAQFAGAVACAPDFAPFYLYLARVQVKLGKLEAAWHNAQRVLELGAQGPLAEEARGLLDSLKPSQPTP